MAAIRPFPSSRPAPARAREVASVPYDVIDTREARVLAEGNPASFLHVCRPEIDLPEGTPLYSDAVYAKGRENLDRFEADGTLLPDPTPRLLVYRQTWRGASQDGLVAGCAVDDYDADVIKKHEKTRKDKEDDRTKHLLVQAAHAEPVFLTYRADASIDARVAKVTSNPPEIDFEAVDGVRHSLWLVPEEDAPFFVRETAKGPVFEVNPATKTFREGTGEARLAHLDDYPLGTDFNHAAEANRRGIKDYHRESDAVFAGNACAIWRYADSPDTPGSPTTNYWTTAALDGIVVRKVRRVPKPDGSDEKTYVELTRVRVGADPETFRVPEGYRREEAPAR